MTKRGVFSDGEIKKLSDYLERFFFVYTIYESTSFDNIYLASIEKYSNGFADDERCSKFTNCTTRVLYGGFCAIGWQAK